MIDLICVLGGGPPMGGMMGGPPMGGMMGGPPMGTFHIETMRGPSIEILKIFNLISRIVQVP